MEVNTTEMESAVQDVECGKSLNDVTFNYAWNPYVLTDALCGPRQPLVRTQSGLFTDVLPMYPQTENEYIRRIQQKDNTGALKLWLLQHKKNPYPSKPEKIMLAILAKMTLTQVSTWFANARRRLKKDCPDVDFFNSGTGGHMIYYQK